MVDVSGKGATKRTARGHAFVSMLRHVLEALPHNPKGNPLDIARIAGVMGEADRGVDPAVPSAAAVARRCRGSGGTGRGTDCDDSVDHGGDGRGDGSADGGKHSGADHL